MKTNKPKDQVVLSVADAAAEASSHSGPGLDLGFIGLLELNVFKYISSEIQVRCVTCVVQGKIVYLLWGCAR